MRWPDKKQLSCGYLLEQKMHLIRDENEKTNFSSFGWNPQEFWISHHYSVKQLWTVFRKESFYFCPEITACMNIFIWLVETKKKEKKNRSLPQKPTCLSLTLWCSYNMFHCVLCKISLSESDTVPTVRSQASEGSVCPVDNGLVFQLNYLILYTQLSIKLSLFNGLQAFTWRALPLDVGVQS